MNVEKIENLEEVLILSKDQRISDYKISRLTAPGENYGSLMLSLDITVQTPKGKEEIHTVAKMIPPNDFIQEVFNTQITFRNEIAFYKNIVPTLQNFQREQGMKKLIDFFPRFYGGRINLTGDPSKVDSNAVLLLENLKLDKFVNLDRRVGFDLETAKLILADLASLHAVPLGLKVKKPEVFEEEVKKYLCSLPVKASDSMFQGLFDLIGSVDQCKPHFDRVKKTIREEIATPREAREPFATISHNDCWVNNAMVKLEEGKPVTNKLVDFQIMDYGSPAKDLIFFLFTSVQAHVIENHYDDLIWFYYENFIHILRDLKCESPQFSYEAFLEEINYEAKKEFPHIIFMLSIIFRQKGTVKELSELQPEDFLSREGPTEEHIQKLALIVTEFAKRNWI